MRPFPSAAGGEASQEASPLIQVGPRGADGLVDLPLAARAGDRLLYYLIVYHILVDDFILYRILLYHIISYHIMLHHRRAEQARLFPDLRGVLLDGPDQVL